jgi:hypothetical protein
MRPLLLKHTSLQYNVQHEGFKLPVQAAWFQVEFEDKLHVVLV